MSQELAYFTGWAWDTATWPAACAGPAYVQHALARPDSQFLCCTCVLFGDILWSEDSVDSHMHATGPRSAPALTQAHPTICHAFT